MRHISIALMLPSELIASGISLILRNMADISCSIIEISGANYAEELSRLNPSLLIVDPINCNIEWCDLKNLSDSPMKIIGILIQQMPKENLHWLDDTISIYDSTDVITDIISRNINRDDEEDKSKDLSPREKEVVIGIVKGLSNKEIASLMNVSVNTVMTHRRNIASKLHIHTPAGLTIFAIVSNLVKLEDIKSDMGKL